MTLNQLGRCQLASMHRARARSHGISNAANPDISAPPLSVRHSHHTTAQVPAEVLDAHAPRPSSRLNRALSQPGRTQARPRSAPTPARARSHPPQATTPADLAAQRTNDYTLETSHIYKGGDLKEFVAGSIFDKNALKVSSLRKVRIGHILCLVSTPIVRNAPLKAPIVHTLGVSR